MENLKKSIKENFKKTGSLEPCFVLKFKEDSKIEIFPIPGQLLNSVEGKEYLNKSLKEYVDSDSRELEYFTMICEIWMSKMKDADEETIKKLKEKGLSSDPNRKECLMISTEYEDETRMEMYEIYRFGNGEAIVLDEPLQDTTTKKNQLEARFSMFKK